MKTYFTGANIALDKWPIICGWCLEFLFVHNNEL